MPSMIEVVCKCGCGRKKQVRTADVKRGWGLFFSKSCKARFQSKNKRHTEHGVEVGDDFVGQTDDDMMECLDAVETGWDSHKSWL